MKYIARSLRLLKAALPESSLEVEATFVDEAALTRGHAAAVMLQLGSLLSSFPSIVEIELTPEGEKDDFGDPEDVMLNAKFKIASGGASSEVVTVTLPSARRSPAYAAHARALERALGRDPEWSGLATSLEKSKLAWQFGRLTLTREDIAASVTGRFIDFDALFSRSRMLNSGISSLQEQWPHPPAYWNRATVAGMSQRLAAGMDPNTCDRNGISALVAAAIFGENDQVLGALCDAGADPNLVDATGHNAVSAAIAAQNWPGFRFLVEVGGDPNGPRSMPSLIVALQTSGAHIGVAQVLDAGGDLNRMMPDGMRFADPLERLDPGAFSDNAWAWKQVTELVRSRSIEAAVLGAIDSAPSPGSRAAANSGPAL